MKATASKTQNIQGISDALEALAQMHVLHDAMQDQISRLEADRTELRNKVEELENEARSLKNERLTLSAELSGLHRDLGEIQDRGDLHDPRHFRILIAAHKLIKAGQTSDALREIERVLRDFDSAWSTGT